MKLNIALVCVSLLAFTASSAFAQSCGRGVFVQGNTVCNTPTIITHTPTVVAHEVITPVVVPVAVPVIVPAFTYQYVPPVTAAPSYPTYPGAPAPGYGAGGYPAPGMPYSQPPAQYGPVQQPPTAPQPVLPGANNNDKLKELAKLLLEEMRRQDAIDNSGNDSGPPTAVYPNSNLPATPAQSPAQAPRTSNRPNPSSPFAQAAINGLARNCMSCHTGPGAKGEVVIFNQHNILNPDAPFRSMLSELNAGRMPPRQSNYHPTPEERNVMSAWLEGR